MVPDPGVAPDYLKRDTGHAYRLEYRGNFLNRSRAISGRDDLDQISGSAARFIAAQLALLLTFRLWTLITK